MPSAGQTTRRRGREAGFVTTDETRARLSEGNRRRWARVRAERESAAAGGPSPRDQVDEQLLALRKRGHSLREIAETVGVTQQTVARRLAALGLPPGVEARPCLPAGHASTWRLLTEGTMLQGAEYPLAEGGARP